jgi:hypothetical protein
MACEFSLELPALHSASTPAYSKIRLILLSAILLSAVHPGFYAVALQDFKAHVYELQPSLVPTDRSNTYDILNRVS